MSPLAQEQHMLLAAAADSASERTVPRPARAPFGCAAALASAAALVILSAGAGAIVHHKFSSTAEVGLSLRTVSKAGAADSKRTLSPSRPSAVAAAASKADRTALTLYCVTVMRQGTYEQGILQWQVDQCASPPAISIFACDGYDVFSEGHALILGMCHGQSIKTVELPVAVPHHNITVDGSIANGWAFRKMWSSLTTKRSYLKKDFTVKVDPDTVFFAHRLRRQLRQQDYPEKCFVSNCMQGDASRRLSGGLGAPQNHFMVGSEIFHFMVGSEDEKSCNDVCEHREMSCFPKVFPDMPQYRFDGSPCKSYKYDEGAGACSSVSNGVCTYFKRDACDTTKPDDNKLICPCARPQMEEDGPSGEDPFGEEGPQGSGAAGNYVGPSFYGSLEIISSAALETYAVQADNPCPHFVGQNWGEDRFMATCLEHLDIPFVTNFNLLSDQYCVNAPIECDGKASAFHPFKSAAEWQECFQNASQSEVTM